VLSAVVADSWNLRVQPTPTAGARTMDVQNRPFLRQGLFTTNVARRWPSGDERDRAGGMVLLLLRPSGRRRVRMRALTVTIKLEPDIDRATISDRSKG